IIFLGLVQVVLGALVVGVRCADSVAEEKRRHTWEDLVMTPLTLEAIQHGKFGGVLLATRPYIVAYSIPMFVLAAKAGPTGVIQATVLVAVAGGAFCIAGCIGAALSMDEEFKKRSRRQRRPRPPRHLPEDYPPWIVEQR